MLVYMASRYFIKVPVAEEKLGQLLSKRDSHRFSLMLIRLSHSIPPQDKDPTLLPG